MTQIKKTKLNPDSEWYRICPEIECRDPFMARNLKTKFCGPNCRDRYHNRIKRQGVSISASPTEPIPMEQSAPPPQPSKCLGNIAILDKLVNDPEGTEYDFKHLREQGLDLSVYDKKVFKPGSTQFFYITIGPYALCRSGENSVLTCYKQYLQ